MSRHTPRDNAAPGAPPTVTRREFLATVGSAAALFSAAALLGDCTGGMSTAPAANPTGTVRGTVADLQGKPQAVGRIYLLTDAGLNQNVYADVDAAGNFNFGSVDVGPYQLRFWGGNLADVPETFSNPVRITVAANQATVVHFQIQLGGLGAIDREIYAGDFFYQEQPYGLPNATVVVPLGTGVCWYNVGQHTHTVTGGPWGDSGDIPPVGNFMWTANQVGTFPYRCTYHSPEMQAVLQVVPA
ncbi:MAG: hypothetical protein ACYCVL_08145 [Gemmatimonadaceae bacterium]